MTVALTPPNNNGRLARTDAKGQLVEREVASRKVSVKVVNGAVATQMNFKRSLGRQLRPAAITTRSGLCQKLTQAASRSPSNLWRPPVLQPAVTMRPHSSNWIRDPTSRSRPCVGGARCHGCDATWSTIWNSV